jgi:hypothetical protein
MAVMFVVAGYIYLQANKDSVSFYGHIFKWWVIPFFYIMGIIFVDRNQKKKYFKRINDDLLIK